MEKVTFLIEETQERLRCMLNPESLVMRRSAGVQLRRSNAGQLTGVGTNDDPLLYTGGGRTELELDLLFDIQFAGSSIQADDVRLLTGPLWALTENLEANGQDYGGHLPLVRFIWGKSWNIPGVVTALAERLEQFTAAGAAQRSWLRMRLVRVDERSLGGVPVPPPSAAMRAGANAGSGGVSGTAAEEGSGGTAGIPVVHVVAAGERLDQIAFRYYGSSLYWPLIALANRILDPRRLYVGQTLVMPLRKFARRLHG